jgi:hypothetical protein
LALIIAALWNIRFSISTTEMSAVTIIPRYDARSRLLLTPEFAYEISIE